MAEVNEQQVQVEGASKVIKRSRSGLWFAVIIFLVIVAMAGGGFYLFTMLRTQQEDLGGELSKDEEKFIEISKQMSSYQSQLASIQDQLGTLEKNIVNNDSQVSTTISNVSELFSEKLDSSHKELGDSINQLQRQLSKTRGDWLIADAEYLLSIANQRLHLMGDVNTTREALEAADERLRESGDSAVFKVREKIAKELAELRKVQAPDIVGIYSSIKALEERIEKLALFLPYAGKAVTPTKEVHSHAEATDESHDWLHALLGKMEGVVTIRHSDRSIKEVLTPEEAEFIRQQLNVKLEMVKLTLLKSNEALYLASLDDAENWLKDHFTQNEEARNFSAELDRLKAIKIHSQFPNVSESLKLLRNISRLRLEAYKPKSVNTVKPQPVE